MDYDALTTNYELSETIHQFSYNTVLAWLSAGVNPGAATVLVQSTVPEHAGPHLMLAMTTPLTWLERMQPNKDQQQKLSDRDLATHRFLGYPLLQAADILIYRAGRVTVGADQVANVELTREIARRFSHVCGRKPGFEEQAEAAVKKMEEKASRRYSDLRCEHQERGEAEALERARALLAKQQNLSMGDTERLFGYLQGGGRTSLSEPRPMRAAQPKMLGLDGEKMSKSYNSSIGLCEEPAVIEEKIRTRQVVPAWRRNDRGSPAQCPIFALHKDYCDDVKHWAIKGCERAGIGCVDCKKPLIDAINSDQEVIRQRACSLRKTQTWFMRLSPRGLKKPAQWLAKPWKKSKFLWHWRPLMSSRFWRDAVYE